MAALAGPGAPRRVPIPSHRGAVTPRRCPASTVSCDHSYSPFKCDGGCQPNTWHWDNVGIEPAVPFTIVPSDRRWASDEHGATVSFAAPAPPESDLRFVEIGTGMEVSFDGGASWQAAQARPIREGKDAPNTFLSYGAPMPEGATSATLRGGDWRAGSWRVRDFSIWSLTPPE